MDRKNTSEEESVKKKTKTNEKVYKFNPDWLKDFKWLEYQASTKLMFRKFCKEAPPSLAGSSLFISGNPNLRRIAVVKHSASTRHSRSALAGMHSSTNHSPATHAWFKSLLAGR